MNHIYKSIFNKALGVFTAVPEFASAHGKGSERTVVGRVAKGTAGFAASALAISVGLALTSTSAVASAGIYVNDGTDPGCLALPDTPYPNTGIYGISSSGNSIVPGNSIINPGYTLVPNSYFGLDQMKPCLPSGDGVHAAATQTNRTLFYGNTHTVDTTNNGSKNLTLGGRLDVNSGIIGVGDRGVNGTGATNSIRMGTGTTLADANKVVNGITIGVDAGASAVGSTAIGANAKARAEYSVALGDSAVSGDNTIGAVNGGGGAIAIGRQSMANNYNAIAIGLKASVSPAAGVTSASDGIAIGSETVVDNYKGIAVGAYSQAKGRQSTVIANNVQGSNYSTASGTRSQVYGAETNVSGNNSVAIGDTNTVASDRTYVMGNNINAAAGTNDSLAFGTKASVGGANAIALGNTAKATKENTIAQGTESVVYGKNSVSIGYKAVSGIETPTPTQTNAFSVSIGNETEAIDASTIAIGDKAKAKGGVDALAVGTQANAMTYKALAIGAYSQATGRQSTVIGNDIQGQPSIASGTRSQILGVQSNVSGDNSVSIGDTNTIASARTYALGNNINAAAGTDDSLAFGTRASVQGANTIAVGNTAQALTDDSISIGRDSKAGKVDKFDGKKSIAIGYASEAMGSNAIALGSNAATNNGHDSIAMGTYAKTNGEKTISIGAYNTAEGAQSIVIAGNYDASTGSNRSTTTAAARRAIVVGPESHATAEDAVAIGNKNTVASARTYALGNNINVAAGADDSLAFGTQANVGAVHSIAMGTTAAATGIGSIALGKSASSTEQRAIAMGENALAGNEASMALGYNSSAKGSKQVSIGLGAGALKNATDAGAELATFVGHYAGADNASPTGNAQGVAVGVNAGRYGVSGIRNVAVGPNTGQKVEGDDNTAIGYNSGRGVKGTNNFAGGANAGVFVEGNNNVALGFNAGIGAEAKPLKVNRTTAVGSDSRALADDSVALGDHAIANNANSVAIGTRSTTSDVHTGAYTLNGSYTAAGLPVAANGTVSVGSAGKERQIQNVAAGVISATSTDAINGSQLYATNNYLSNLATGVQNVLGGDAAVDNAGNLTMSNIGGTGKGNVNDAIAAANTKVAAGENITVTPTTNTDGSKTYTVATKKDLVVDSVKAGDTTVNTDGVTIANGPSVKKDGINAGDKKITGVADGNVAAGSKDAVNGGQLAEVKAKADSAVQNVVSANPTALTATKAGDTVTLTPNFIAGDLVNADGTVNTPAAADEGKLVSAKTVVDALKANHFVVDTKANGGTVDAASEEDAKVGSGNKVTFEAGKNLVAQQTNTANGGATVNYKLSDTLENLVSVKSAEIEAGIGPNKVVLNNNGVKVGDSTLNDKGLSINNGPSVTDAGIDAGNKKITGVANGNVAAGSTDAVNGGQLAEVKSKADSAVQDVKSGDENALTAVKDPNTNIVTVTPKLSGDLVDTNGNITAPTTPEEKGKLVTAGTVAEALANTHFVVDTKATDGELDAASQADQKIKASNKVTLQAGKNLKAKQTNGANGAEVEFSLKDSISLKEVKVGEGSANEVVLNNNGVNVAGNTYINKDGLNANDKKITNVAPGAVTAASKDAVNGSQLYNVANNVKDLIGPDAAIDPATGKVTVADPAKGIGETGKGNIGDAIKHVNDLAKNAADTAKKHTTVEQGDNIVVEESLNADGGKHYKVSTAKDLNVDSVKAGDTTVNNDGVTIAGGPSVTKGGINAGGNTITNVADGVNPNDAVNKGQLDAVKGVADSAVKSVDVANGEQNLVVDNSDPKNPKLSLKKDLTVDSVKAGDSTLNNDGLTIAGGPSVKKDGIDAADKKITNVAAGDVAENSKDAVNGGQLYDVAKNVADLVGPDAKIDPATGKVTVADPAKGIGETGKGNIGDAIKHVNDLAKNAADTAKKHTTVEQGDNIVVEESLNADGGKHYKVSTAKDLNVDSVKAGDTTVNNDGVTINNGPSMTKDGINANNTKVTNVADGVNPNDAVNKGQLDKVDTKVSNVAQNVVNVLGGDATVNGNGDITMSNIGETGKGNINDAIKSVNDLAKKAAAEKTSVKAKEGRSNVTVTEGVNAAGGHEYTVDVERSVTNAGSDYVTVTNNHDADSNTTTYTVDVSAKTKASLAKADSAVQGLTSKDGNLNFTKGANGNVEVSFNDNLNVKNVTTDRVQVANGPSMSKDGINAAGKAISNVANGNVAADSKDAVNGGQLHETAKSVADVIGGGATVKDGKVVAGKNGIGNTGQNTVHGAIAAINQNTANNFNQIRGDLRKMDRDLRGGIAGALATAGLPQAFRPGKSMVAAAASTYRGQSGLAIGVSRISDNGKVILKVTGNTNSRGDFGGTIGAGYQW